MRQPQALRHGENSRGQFVIGGALQGGGHRAEGPGRVSPFAVEHDIDPALQELATRSEGDRDRSGCDQRTAQTRVAS